MTAINAQIVPVTPFQQNCVILHAPETQTAVVIDPGGETQRLLDAARQLGVTIKEIWLTHGHLDHAGAAMALKRETGAPIIGPHKADKFWLDQIPEHAAKYGWQGEAEAVLPDRWLEDGDTVELEGVVFNVIHTPGHTPGHVVFANNDLKIAFVGDVIFRGSIGRTDFPQSDHQSLLDSITKKLWPLGSDMRFSPGHGPMSTFGQERADNPFVADRVMANG